MNSYRVIVAPVAAKSIADYGQYIAEVAGKPETAERWVNHVYDKISTLDAFPQRHALAEENGQREYEIRRQIIGNYLVLYSIDEASLTVHVVGFRHGHRLPQSEILPEKLD